MTDFQPRPKQQEVLAYTLGRMGVAAVPGSGKTWTLSQLAAKLILDGRIDEDQEILIVTLVNSAVDNFATRIGQSVERRGLLPQVGYRVRTLHGLANDIVRLRPDLVGLSPDFDILDERLSQAILQDVVGAWLKANPYSFDDYFSPDTDGDENKRDWLRRERLPDLVTALAGQAIAYAKDWECTPQRLAARLEQLGLALPLAEAGQTLYAGYQRALDYRGAVDFADLIRLALQALERDPGFLERLQARWPYILEDEAQDSSQLQERILETLAGAHGNWVRVGDPNQAIFESFTTASPQHLRDFIARADQPRQLPNSGRSTQSIIYLANELIRWSMLEHPHPDVRDALAPPEIKPAPPGDIQPNPPDDPAGIQLVDTAFSPEAEVAWVIDSLQAWLAEHPEQTVAVLAPRNQRGFQVVDALRQRGIEPIDNLLRSSTSTRLAAGALANLLAYLADPKSAKRLATVYRVWRRADRDDETLASQADAVAERLAKLPRVEDYLWPSPERDWLDELGSAGQSPELLAHLAEFRDLVQRWQGAVLLPVDQLVLALAADLFTDTTELAIAHKLAILLRGAAREHADWRLPELTEELALIARNERRFLGFADDESGFDPEQYRGQVVVATMHKAKGLEWDRVYLMSVSNYDFPSAQAYDSFIGDTWYIRDRLNLGAEALAQVDLLLGIHPDDHYQEGAASEAARLEYVRERLRLLYVGITRARRQLVVTWNTGRKNDNQPALPLAALQAFWEAHHDPAN